jgi:hypothetical protein
VSEREREREEMHLFLLVDAELLSKELLLPTLFLQALTPIYVHS